MPPKTNGSSVFDMTNKIDGIVRTDHPDTITVDAFNIHSALGLVEGVLATAPLTVEHRDDLAAAVDALRTSLA